MYSRNTCVLAAKIGVVPMPPIIGSKAYLWTLTEPTWSSFACSQESSEPTRVYRQISYVSFVKGTASAVPKQRREKGALAPEVRLLLPHFDSLYLSHGLPSAAKAAFLATAFCGTAEAVPLTDTGARVKVEVL